MRITRLYLKNFIHIYSGMHKRVVELNLKDIDKKINIFIGKMGSGKTAILGHLQPFSSYGTLDSRNQEDLILAEEDGLKEIEYEINDHYYKIQHKYTWNKSSKTHSVKSYIQRDGIELNENGNVRSFKEIIKLEFGIEQNFLRLLRLGPNVSNLINMKSTERKSFIASLLEDADVYTTLFQKINEDYRGINSILSVMSNKLNSLSADKESEMKIELSQLTDIVSKLQEDIQKDREEISRLIGINQSISSNKSIDELLEIIKKSNEIKDHLLQEMNLIHEKLDKTPLENIEDLSIQYGKISAILVNLEESIISITSKYDSTESDRNKIRDYLLLQKSNTQIQSLETQLQIAYQKYKEAEEGINNFQCKYSYEYLGSLQTSIESFQFAIEELCANSEKVIHKLYYSDNTLGKWANRQLNILRGRQVNLKKLLNNIQFSIEYECPLPLYRPPMCPTDNCPFIISHPQIIKEKNSHKCNQKIMDLKHEIDSLEIEISECEDCIYQIPKMDFVKKLWEKISIPLKNIGALNENKLITILTNLNSRCHWYSPDVLQSTIEKLKMQDSYESLKSNYFILKNELIELKASIGKYNNEDLEMKDNELSKLMNELKELQIKKETTMKEKERIEELLEILRDSENLKERHKKLSDEYNSQITQIDDLTHIINRMQVNLSMITDLQKSIQENSIIYNQKMSRLNQLNTIMQDIKSTTESYNEYLEERNILKTLLDAVSSKEGIPVIMVKLFLDECKSIVNDLIADIFDDDLEILDFDLREDTNEFKIPYLINGVAVEDISSASQGQTSVISIALSFALCRKAMFDYNIMLLDEIDNSIHKRDREKFIAILSKQMNSVHSEQIFLITHNDIFQQSGLPVNIILTTPESIDIYPNQSKITLF